MKRVLAVLVFGLLASSPAFAFRCGTKLVSEGDSRAEVAHKCGEPTDVVNQRSVFRRPVIWGYGRHRSQFIGEDYIEVPVETWLYNLGPNKLMRRVRFEGGYVVEIETLGYGYNQ
ncbi:MAG TPA: DUF2845 domain-containing protein [Steroidobacteraceae bacterium]|nr:DUF2845 domain-containing protein [Steroidobacteraceae bacterium]